MNLRKRFYTTKVVNNLEGSLFIAPWLIGFFLFFAVPLSYSLYMSFNSVRVLPKGVEMNFVGLIYYREILIGSPKLHDELLPFLREVLIMIPIIIIFALMIAIMLNQKFKGRFLFRAVFFLPVIFSSGYVITELITQGQGSLGFIERYNVEESISYYLGDNIWATTLNELLHRFILILWYSGVQILIFLAGRQTISGSVYESARIDGASPWEIFWKITLPAMLPFIFLNLVYTTIDMFTYPFNPILNMIQFDNYGFNSAFAWTYFVIIFLFLSIITLMFLRISRFRTRK